MKKKGYVLLSFEGSDNALIRQIAEHMGIPRIAVVRLAVRFYASHGPWPVGANGVRDHVIASASVVDAKNGSTKKRRKKTS